MARQESIRFILGFDADTSKARAEIQNLAKSLDSISKMPTTKGMHFDKDIKAASEAALILKRNLGDALNPKTGILDMTRFATNLKAAGTSVSQLSKDLTKAGEVGQKAFIGLSEQIAKSTQSTYRINGMITKFGEQLKQTVKWQLSTSTYRAIVGSLSSAYNYAKDLNESLNNIQIVTGQSSEQMKQFAEQANKSAKALSTTTTAYTDAALIFAQQGLKGDEITKRTDAVVKMSQVTGQSATEVSSQMTAIWNNFAKGSDNLEHFSDVVTALGAATASSSSEIATGLEKFASVAETVGLSYETATASLATVVAETRQSADVVGTAFKTIFARMQGLQLDGEEAVELNKYSKALQDVGVNVLNVDGQLKKLDIILPEIANKWQILGEAQKTALAQSVAGTRQYAQFMALMNNWNKVERNIGVAKDSDGELQRQADVYEKSWAAASKRVKANLEELYSSLVNDDFFISMTEGLAEVVHSIETVIKSMGGFKGVLMTVSTLFMSTYANKMPDVLKNIQHNFYVLTGQSQKLANSLKADFSNALNGLMGSIDKNSGLASKIQGLEQIFDLNNKIAQKTKFMTEEEESYYRMQINLLREVNEELAKEIDKRNELSLKVKNAAKNFAPTDATKVSNLNNTNKEDLRKIKGDMKVDQGAPNGNQQVIKMLQEEEGINKLIEKYIELENIRREADAITTQLNNNAGIKWDDEITDVEILKEKMVSLLNTQKEVLSFKGYESAVVAFDVLINEINNGIFTIDQLKDHWKQAFQEMNSSGVYEIDLTVEGLASRVEAFERILSTLNPEAFNKLKNALNEDGIALENIIKEMFSFQDAFAGVGSRIKELQMKNSQFIMTLGSAAMAVSQLINSFKNLKDIFSDDESTWLDRILAVTQLLIPASMLLNSVTKINEAMNNANTASVTANAAARGAQNRSLAEGVRNFKNNTIAGIRNGFSNIGSSLKSSLANLGKIALAVGAIIAAVEIWKRIIDSVNKQIDELNNKQQKEAENAQISASNLKTRYEELKGTYEDFVASVDQYNELKSGLSDLVAGTEEYNQKLHETNETALDLMKTLNGKVTGEWQNGQLVLDKVSLENAKNEQARELAKAKIESDNAEIKAKQTTRKAQMADLVRAENDQSTGSAVGHGAKGLGQGSIAGAATGAAVGATIGLIIPGVGNAIGAGIGALIGSIGAAIAGGVYGGIEGVKKGEAKSDAAAVDQANKNVDKLVAQYKLLGDKALTDSAIKQMEGFQNASTELVNTIRDNVKSIVDSENLLLNATKENIFPILEDLSSYQRISNQKDKDTYINAVANNLINQKNERINKLKKESEDWNEDDDWKNYAKQYAAKQGTVTEIKDNEEDEGNSWILKIITDDGAKEISVDKESILEFKTDEEIYDESNVAKTGDEISKTLDKIKNEYGSAMTELYGSGTLKNSIVGDIQTLYQNKASNKYLTEKTEETLDSTYDNINKLLESNYKTVTDTIKDYDYSKLTYSGLATLRSALDTAYQKAGEEGVKNVSNVFDKFKTEKKFEKFTTALSSLDIDNNIVTLEDFKTVLGEAGIELKKLTDREIQDFIDSIQTMGQNLESIQDSYAKTKKITQGLAQGDSISKEDWESLSPYIKTFFQEMLDGTYKLIKSAKELNDIVDNQARTKLDVRRNLLLNDITDKKTELNNQKEISFKTPYKIATIDNTNTNWDQIADFITRNSLAGTSSYPWLPNYLNFTDEEKKKLEDNNSSVVKEIRDAKNKKVANYLKENSEKYYYNLAKNNFNKYTTLTTKSNKDTTDNIFGESFDSAFNWRANLNSFLSENNVSNTDRAWALIPEEQKRLTDQETKALKDTLDYLYEYDKENREIINTYLTKFKEGTLNKNDFSSIDKLYTDQISESSGYSKQIKDQMAEIIQSYMVEASSYENIEKLEEGFFGEEGYAGAKKQIEGDTPASTDLLAKVDAYNNEAILRNQNNLHGLDETEVEKYADYLDDLTESVAGFNTEMNKDTAEIYAKQIMRMNRGVEALAKNFYDLSKKGEGWFSILDQKGKGNGSTKGSEEYKDAIIGTKEALADLLDTETTAIDNEFIEDHLKLIKEAAQGNEDAIDKLKKKLGEDVRIKIIDDLKDAIPDIETKFDDLDKFMKQIQDGEIDINTERAKKSLQDLLNATGMSAEQIKEYMNDAWNTDIKYKTKTASTDSYMPITRTVTKVESEDVPWSAGNEAGVYHYETATSTPEVIGKVAVPQQFAMFGMSSDGSEPEIDMVTEKASGSANNYSSVNAGGPSASKPTKKKSSGGKKNKEKKEQLFDPFRNIDRTINKMGKDLKDLEAVQDKVFGISYINNLKEQNRLLEEQRGLYRKRAKETYQYNIKKSMKDLEQYSFSKTKVKFDPTFGVDQKSYRTLAQDAQKEVDSLTDIYNKNRTDKNKERLDNAKEQVKNLNSTISEIDANADKLREMFEVDRDAYFQELENKLKTTEYKIQVKLDVEEAEIKLKNWIKDAKTNFLGTRGKYGINNNTALELKTLQDTQKNKLNKFNEQKSEYDNAVGLKERVKNLTSKDLKRMKGKNATKEDKKLVKLLESAGINVDFSNKGAKGIQDIKDGVNEYINKQGDKLAEIAEEYKAAYQEAVSKYLEIVNQVAEAWSDIEDDLSKVAEDLDYYSKLNDLYYGEGTSAYYNNKMAINQAKEQAAQEKIKTGKKQQENYQILMGDKRNGMDENAFSEWLKSNKFYKEDNEESRTAFLRQDEDYKQFEEGFEKGKKLEREGIIEGAEAAKEIFESTIDHAFDQAEQQMFNGYTADEVSEQWELKKESAQGYYDSVQKIYQIESMESKWQALIYKSSSIKAQEKLTNLMKKQQEYLQNKVNLSEKDIQIAERELKVEEARIALEEAQKNKSSMKLVRDSNGNWNYQYVQDTNAVNEAQQRVYDAENDMRDTALQAKEEGEAQLLERLKKYRAIGSALQKRLGAVGLSEEEEQIIKDQIAENNRAYEEDLKRISSSISGYTTKTNQATGAMVFDMYNNGDIKYEDLNDTEKDLIDLMNRNGGFDGDFYSISDDIISKANNLNEAIVGTWKTILSETVNSLNTGKTNIGNIINEITTTCTNAINTFRTKANEAEELSGDSFISNFANVINQIVTDINSIPGKIEKVVSTSSSLADAQETVDAYKAAWTTIATETGDALQNIYDIKEETKKEIKLKLNTKQADTAFENWLKKIKANKTQTITLKVNTDYQKTPNADSKDKDTSKDKPTPKPENSSKPNPSGLKFKSLTSNKDKNGKISWGLGKESSYEGISTEQAKKFIKDIKLYKKAYKWVDKPTKVSPEEAEEYRKSYNNFFKDNKSILKKLGIKTQEELNEFINQKGISTLSAFDTGGYTGDWNSSEGRLALLHEKELVLNKDDTANMLSMINIVRDLVDQQLPQKLMQNMYQKIKGALIDYSGAISSNSNSSNENIFNISAEFPNANNAAEIQEAILSLPNLASQYLNRRR